MDMANMPVNEPLEPVVALTEPATHREAPHHGSGAGDSDRTIEVSSSSVRIHELTIERPAIAAYLEHIAPEKLEIALVHALEVGVTELVARRERFKK
jgi:hypothetical protein